MASSLAMEMPSFSKRKGMIFLECLVPRIFSISMAFFLVLPTRTLYNTITLSTTNSSNPRPLYWSGLFSASEMKTITL